MAVNQQSEEMRLSFVYAIIFQYGSDVMFKVFSSGMNRELFGG
jgi:hypothetical protein